MLLIQVMFFDIEDILELNGIKYQIQLVSLYIVLTLLTFILMEEFLYLVFFWLHRYVMHSVGWYLHKEPSPERVKCFEKK